MSYNINMNNTVCFTGHRPSQLPFVFNKNNLEYQKLESKLTSIILDLIHKGYTNFISGMALGVDMMCAEIVLSIKKDNPNIKLYCYLPCKNQDKLWSTFDKKQYQNILSHSDGITYATNSNFCTGCLQLRNKMMVNDSQVVVAVYYGKDGGTRETINYATQQNKEIIYIN